MFVRRKTVKGNRYYYLVRNYREAGKHKQKVLCYLGRYKSLEAAIAGERELAEHHGLEAAYWSEEAQIIRDTLLTEHNDKIAAVPSRKQAYFRWRGFWREYRKEYQKPYAQWYWAPFRGRRVDMGAYFEEYDLWAERQVEERKAEEEEWEKRRQWWAERKEAEGELLGLVYEYHYAVSEVRQHEKRADVHQAALNKFLEVKQKHS